jgi:hypothetical protein
MSGDGVVVLLLLLLLSTECSTPPAAELSRLGVLGKFWAFVAALCYCSTQRLHETVRC